MKVHKGPVTRIYRPKITCHKTLCYVSKKLDTYCIK